MVVTDESKMLKILDDIEAFIKKVELREYSTSEKRNLTLEFYENANDRKKYCIYLSEEFDRYGLGSVLWTSIQTNWFSKRNLPREQYKINKLFDFTLEFARRERAEIQESLRTEAEGQPT